MRVTFNYSLENMRSFIPLHVTVEAESPLSAIEPAIEEIRSRYSFVKGKGYIFLPGNRVKEFDMQTTGIE